MRMAFVTASSPRAPAFAVKKLLSDAISMFIDAAENQDASITAERDGLVAAKMLLALVEMRKEQAARMKTL